MSSLFYVSNASSKSEEFTLKDIEVLVDSKEQNWFKRAHVGKFLGIEDIQASLNSLENCEILTRKELIPTRRGTRGWSEPKDHQNKTNKFLEEERQTHQQQILRLTEDHQQAIEEKDTMITLLNDDLKNCESDNVALQAQTDVHKEHLQKCQDIITHLKTRYVDHAKDPGKGSIVMIVTKNTALEEDEFHKYPYNIARIQRRFINTKRRWLKHNTPIMDL